MAAKPLAGSWRHPVAVQVSTVHGSPSSHEMALWIGPSMGSQKSVVQTFPSSQLTGLPALFVRKEAKTYGTCRLAEGGELGGRRLTVVEDVVTSGGQVVTSCGDLRERGALVEHAVCVIDREAGGAKNLVEVDVELRPLYTMRELADAAG